MQGFEFTVKGAIIASVPLSRLELSKRAEHVLMREDIWDLEGVTNAWGRLSRLRGCGADTTKEIRVKFFNWYLTAIAEDEERKKQFLDSIALHEVMA